MKSKTLRIIVVAAVTIALASFFIFFTKNKHPSNTREVVSSVEQSNNVQNVKADLNGDGKQDTLRLTLKNTDASFEVDSLVAYDDSGKELGRLPNSMPIAPPMTGTGRVYTPIAKEKNQFVSFDFIVGPHSSETMFFGLFEIKTGGSAVLPVCLSEKADQASKCLFWSGEVNELAAKDLDGDGNLEVIETVDEYPKDGPITAEIEKIVQDTWKDTDQQTKNDALRVLKREQGGRGRKVVWGIYRYNGFYFEEQTGAKYDKYLPLAKTYLRSAYPNYPEIIKKDQMSKESFDYNIFMKKFWTHE